MKQEAKKNLKNNKNKNKIHADNKAKKCNKLVENSLGLTYLDYYPKNVKADGNCYFRCLSYYYRDTEEYYNEFRLLIYELFKANIKTFIDYPPDYKMFNKSQPKNEKEILELLNLYAEKIKEDKNWATLIIKIILIDLLKKN